MDKKFVGWAIAGAVAVLWLLESGKGIEFTRNIARMPEHYRYQKWLSEQPPGKCVRDPISGRMACLPPGDFVGIHGQGTISYAGGQRKTWYKINGLRYSLENGKLVKMPGDR